MGKKWSNNKPEKNNSALTPWEKEQKKRQKQRKKADRQSVFERIGSQLPKTSKQRKLRLRKHAVILLSFLTIVALISLYFCLPCSRANSVSVTTNNEYVSRQIKRASGIKKHESFFPIFWRRHKIIEQVKSQVPAVKKASLSFRSGKLVIQVKVYPLIGFISENNYYQGLTATGGILTGPIKQTDDNYPVLYGFGKNKAKLKETTAALGEISPKIRKAIAEIHYHPVKTNPDRLHLYMNDGNEVLISVNSFHSKMEYYPSIVAKLKHKSMIDLEVGAYSYNLKK